MTGHTPGAATGAEELAAVAELRASVGDAVVDAAEALDDLIMSNGIALDEERLDWLADWLARRDADQQAKALRDVRERLRLRMNAVPTTDGNDTYPDGYFSGLAEAIGELDRDLRTYRAAALASDRDERGDRA